MRSLFFFGVIVCVCVVFVSSCKTKPDAVPHIGRYYTGVLFGRPFSIDVVGDSLDYQASIDSIIRLYEMNFNALDKSSVISRINAFSSRDSVFTFNDSSHVFGLVY
ncbi:MAG: hypothetical protein ACKO7B_21845, partial [Flavobacteriales bacterium]